MFQQIKKKPLLARGATKQLMEDFILSYKYSFHLSTARFAKVAFSDGSLSDSFINRIEKKYIVFPNNVNKYFVSHEEAGSLCLLACFFVSSGEIVIPKLSSITGLISFEHILRKFFKVIGLKDLVCELEKDELEKVKLIKNHRV